MRLSTVVVLWVGCCSGQFGREAVSGAEMCFFVRIDRVEVGDHSGAPVGRLRQDQTFRSGESGPLHKRRGEDS